MGRRGRIALPVLWLCICAAVIRALSLPGWVWGPLAVIYVPSRIAYWESGGNWAGDYIGGILFFTLAYLFLVPIHPLAPLLPALCFGVSWPAERFAYHRFRHFLSPSTSGCLSLAASEYLRSIVPMGGFPWTSMGSGFAETPLINIGNVFGESGVSFLVICFGAVLYGFLKRKIAWELLPIPAVMLCIWLFVEPANVPSAHLNCLAVQPNVGVNDKQLPPIELFLIEQELTKDGLNDGFQPDLVIWPETMWPFCGVPEAGVGLIRRESSGLSAETYPLSKLQQSQSHAITDLLSDFDKRPYFLTGSYWLSPLQDGAPAYLISERSNELLLFDRKGELLAHVSKQKLVPFGERLPFGGNFPFVSGAVKDFFASLGLHPDFVVGDRAGPLPGTEDLPTLGTGICWDTVFEEVFRNQLNPVGPRAFVIVSNEILFSSSAEMEQMLASTRWRAIETGRAILRVTNSGLTALVGNKGELLHELTPGIRIAQKIELPLVPADTNTHYARWGWLVLPFSFWLALLLLMGSVGFCPWRK